MKNVLKIWLVDNTVTVDNKDDKIGQLESSGNLSFRIYSMRCTRKTPGSVPKPSSTS